MNGNIDVGLNPISDERWRQLEGVLNSSWTYDSQNEITEERKFGLMYDFGSYIVYVFYTFVTKLVENLSTKMKYWS
jgi:hypothetical protein